MAITQYRKQTYGWSPEATQVSSIMFKQSSGLRLARSDGFVTTELMRLHQSGITMGRVTSSGHEIEVFESEQLTILMPRHGHLVVKVGDCFHVVGPENPTAFRPTQRHTKATPDRSGQFRATTIQIPIARIDMLAGLEDGSGARAFCDDVVGLRRRIQQETLRSIAMLCDDIFLLPGSELPQKVLQAIVNWLDEILVAAPDDRAEDLLNRTIPAFHRVRQAEDIMRDRSDEPLSMIEIATHLGVSLRSLQLAFKLVHDGQSPRAYLNRVRLDLARARLLSAGESENVTSIALDSGFFHLGRFSQTYARTFGERPSDTLARRQA